MPRQRAARLGYGVRPVPGHRPKQRVVGRPRRAVPRFGMPSWGARWRRVVLPVLAVVAVALAGWWLYRSPLLSIRDVTVEGSQALSPEMVRSIADLDGRSIIRPDFEGARERLLALPVVREARISRDWPAGARITVVEREPWGVWQVGGQLLVIDEEGVVLELPPPEDPAVIVQTDAPSPAAAAGGSVDLGAVAVARELVSTADRTLGRSVIGLEFSQASGLTAVLTDGLRVTFGDAQGYEFKVASLFALLRRAEEEGRTLHSVDLRFGDRVAVR